MKRSLPFIIIVAVALLAVGAGGMLYRAKQHALPSASAVPESSAKLDEKEAHILGDPKAPVTLEEFGDYQCPSCSLVAGAIHDLKREYGSRLCVIFRNFPLKMHRHAAEAAFAAEAAGLQGRFWEMHDLIYQDQVIWSDAPDVRPLFEDYAKNLGLDVERFKKDFTAPETNSRVASDTKLGLDRDVQNTPSIFINGRLLPPPFSPDHMREAIEAELAKKKSPSP